MTAAIVWYAIAAVAAGTAAFWPRRRPQPAYRLYVWANAPDADGLRSWRWEVRERKHPAEVFVCGTCVSWRRALEDGMFIRDRCEEGWYGQHRLDLPGQK